jgi:hypothetical protein
MLSDHSENCPIIFEQAQSLLPLVIQESPQGEGNLLNARSRPRP